MTTEHPGNHAVRIALIAAAVAFFALLASPIAKASDTFRFDNETEIPFTASAQDEFEEGYWYGATGVFHPGPTPSESGSVIGDAGGCEREWWGSNLSFDQTYGGTWEQRGVSVYYWYGGTGAFNFEAEDPFIGDSTVSCSANGSEWAADVGATPIEDFMTSEADGDTCTVEWLPGVSASDLDLSTVSARPRAGHIRMIDSLSRVYDGKAHVRVQVFGLGHARHDNEVTLRTVAGRLIGGASRELRVGSKPQAIAVPLSRPVRKMVAEGKDVRVHAAVQIDSPGGTGDTTTQLVLSSRHTRHH
jgi:hypothetical protein